MNDFDQFKTTFFAECAELLADLETELGAIQDGASDSETLNSIFRAVHSIKAGAGAFKMAALAEFAHQFEALLDCLRNGEVPVVEEVVSVLFRSNDILAELVDASRENRAIEEGFGKDVAMELQTLLTTARPANAAPAADASPENVEDANEDGSEEDAGVQTFTVSFIPKATLFQHANEPLYIARELKGLGAYSPTADLSGLPGLKSLDPEGAYLNWSFEITTDRGVEAIEEAFEFVGDDCDLTISVSAPQDKAAVDDAPAADAAEETAQTPPTEAAAASAPSRTSQSSSIRVDLDRVDRLVNMVGEIVITQSMLSQQTAEIQEERLMSLVRGIEELALHTRELQESVMAIRMQPVKSVFARMPRLVRDLSRKLDKKVRLELVGESTEVDTTIVEEISDPITHMIRNSLDHGVEAEADRVAAGKPAEATITLSAEHRSGRILITIEDDGRGIDRERVLAKARERGIVGDDQEITDEEIDNLIFAPGFSTAQAVTDVSGRGVGMDVVRRNVQALGGRVNIVNMPGKGTRFTMALPLTLAVMDGMVVATGNEKYVVPITAIVESLRPEKSALGRLPNGTEVIQVRGEYIPLVYLYRAFNVRGAISDPCKALVVLVDTDEHGRIGLVVDELLGQQQVVIKSLESNYDPVEGISGATILGNGRVAAILDVESLSSPSIHEYRRNADQDQMLSELVAGNALEIQHQSIEGATV